MARRVAKVRRQGRARRNRFVDLRAGRVRVSNRDDDASGTQKADELPGALVLRRKRYQLHQPAASVLNSVEQLAGIRDAKAFRVRADGPFGGRDERAFEVNPPNGRAQVGSTFQRRRDRRRRANHRLRSVRRQRRTATENAVAQHFIENRDDAVFRQPRRRKLDADRAVHLNIEKPRRDNRQAVATVRAANPDAAIGSGVVERLDRNDFPAGNANLDRRRRVEAPPAIRPNFRLRRRNARFFRSFRRHFPSSAFAFVRPV